MLCPYCGKEMEKGYIQSGRSFYWSSEKKGDGLPNANAGDIAFSSSFWSGAFLDAHICRGCGKLLADLPEEKK